MFRINSNLLLYIQIAALTENCKTYDFKNKSKFMKILVLILFENM